MSAVEQYLKYLNLPRKQYNGVVEKPLRDSTLERFEKIHHANPDMSDRAKNVIEQAIIDGKQILCWSDHHFNHDMLWKNGYRNFASREEMNEQMLKALDNVDENSVIIFGGDLAFYQINDVLEKINKIKCQKVYVVGNHDVKEVSKIRKYFDIVTIAFEFNMILNQNPRKVIVTHYPINQEDLLDDQINLHGHTHLYLMGEQCINMCVEHTGYSPKKIQDLFETQLNAVNSNKIKII